MVLVGETDILDSSLRSIGIDEDGGVSLDETIPLEVGWNTLGLSSC